MSVSFRNENRFRLFYHHSQNWSNFFLSISFRNFFFVIFCFFAALIQFVTFYLTFFFQVLSLCFFFAFIFVSDLFFHDIIFYFEFLQNVFRFFVRNSCFFFIFMYQIFFKNLSKYSSEFEYYMNWNQIKFWCCKIIRCWYAQ